jgi:hypothetical protein
VEPQKWLDFPLEKGRNDEFPTKYFFKAGKAEGETHLQRYTQKRKNIPK